MAKSHIKSSKRILGSSVATRASPLLKLPLEIRETIYRMLLTTRCTYTETLRGKVTAAGKQQTLGKTTELVSTGRFNLSPAILQVNKQIAEEATRILYRANEFIIVNIAPSYPQEAIGRPTVIKAFRDVFEFYALQTFRNVPAFRKLSQAKVTDPILRVSIAMTEKPQDQENWFTLIISPEVIPRLFDALWIYGADRGFYTNCSLALDFRNRNPSRYAFLNEHILKMWDQMYPFGEVKLTGDIDAVVTNHLKQPSALFPFGEIIARNLEMLQSRAEDFYKRNDFASAYFYWYHLQRYWTFYLQLEELTHTSLTGLLFARPPETRLVKALNVSVYKVGVSVFGILKILLRLRNYTLAARIAKSPTKWLNRDGMEFMWNLKPYTSIAPVLRVKFAFCCALALVAQGQYQDGKHYIRYGVLRLRNYGDLYAQSTYEEMFNELCHAIDNELIQRESRWRCGLRDKVGPKKQGGSDWQLHTGCLPFWDWLEIPDEEPGPEYWDEDYDSEYAGPWEYFKNNL